MRPLAYCSLILCCSAAPQVRSQVRDYREATLYTSPDSSFQWVADSQQVAGIDIELLGCHIELSSKYRDTRTDTTTIQFIVPEGVLLNIKLRTEQFVSTLKRLNGEWPPGESQCLKVPTASIEKNFRNEPVVYAFGEGRHDGTRMIIPVSWNAYLPDSLSQYTFWFMPNMDIEVSYSVAQLNNDGEWERILNHTQPDFFPGRANFNLSWDGRIDGEHAPDGIYQINLKGYRYFNASQLDLVRSFIFYHQTKYEPCFGT